MSEPVKITVDGREIEVDAGELLIEAAQKAGTYIPRFCWHSRMKPVGMCRMCLVEVEGPRGTMLTTSCTMPVNDGMVVHTASETVKKAQEGVLEFLLINHPLDCPVCDRGGECPLQDQTMSHGPGESRYVEEKRHYEKPIPISDLVLLDRERCILCARCSRFSDEISGDPLIEFIDRGNHTQINTFPDEPFSSYFSGNTVQICPVGALTATPYRFRARPWDLEAVESTCSGCSVGCRVSVQSSQNEILRLLGVDVDATNHGWLCDKGRFGFQHLSAPERLTTPMVKGDDGELQPATWNEALDAAATGLATLIDSGGEEAVAGLGGARNTNEEALAFERLLRHTIGTPHLDARMGDSLDAELLAAGPKRGVIDDLERAATVLVWGPDLKEELPVLYLRVRRAATELGATLIVVHPKGTGLDADADHTVRYRPGEGGALLSRLIAGDGDLAPVRAALDAGPVVAIVGRGGLTEDADLAGAVAGFAASLPDVSVLPVSRRPNLYGAIDMGLSPGMAPGRMSDDPGRDADGIIAGLGDRTIKGLILLGADPVADHPSGTAGAALSNAEFVVSVDLFINDSNRGANVVFPAAGFAEVEGTMTNLEGRVQKVNRLVPAPGQARPANEILADLADRLGGEWEATSAESLGSDITTLEPYAEASWQALDWGKGRDGVLARGGDVTFSAPSPGTPTSSKSGFALHLGRVLYDSGTAVTMGPSLAKLAPKPRLYLHPDDAASLQVAAGDQVRIAGSAGSAEVEAGLDPSLAAGTVYLPFNRGVAVGSDPTVTVERLS
jgi:NADH-quinone oxidoreductase subunit G